MGGGSENRLRVFENKMLRKLRGKKTRISCRFLVGKTEGRGPWGKLRRLGRININMCLKIKMLERAVE